MAAVSRKGVALGYASKELRSDKEVVLAAVSHRGSALDFASDELKNDKEVVIAAISGARKNILIGIEVFQPRQFFPLVGNSLRNAPDVLAACGLNFKHRFFRPAQGGGADAAPAQTNYCRFQFM